MDRLGQSRVDHLSGTGWDDGAIWACVRNVGWLRCCEQRPTRRDNDASQGGRRKASELSMTPLNSVEIQARSVEEAVRLALEQLGRDRDDVDVEVLMDTSDLEDGEALVRVTTRGRSATSPTTQNVPVVTNQASEGAERLAKSIVSDLLAKMGFDCDVVAVDNPSAIELGREEPPTIFIDIMGRDLGMLIGRRGEHLAQLQYMVNVLANKHFESWTRVIIDVEGYRSRREESLIGLAHRVARQVARNRRPISLEPMPPNERRVVHVALRDDPNVTTQSSGEAALRRVTIYPKQR
jgi:spoIIIJ-associated protein